MNMINFTSSPPTYSDTTAPSYAPANEPTVEPAAIQAPEVPVYPECDIPNYDFYIPANNIPQVVNFDIHGDELYVDICIAVNSHLYKLDGYVKKRLKFCKKSLIQQASFRDQIANTTATFVEEKKPAEPDNTTQRMLELAGINHPKNYVR